MILGFERQKQKKQGYNVCRNLEDGEASTSIVKSNKNKNRRNEFKNNQSGDISMYELSEEDFTLRTVESMEADGSMMVSKATNTTEIGITPIKARGASNKNRSGGGIVTSTPRRKKVKAEKRTTSETEAIFLELSGEAEAAPQFFPTHYFNILNIFGVGCSNYKVATVAENHKKSMINTNTNVTQNSDRSIGMPMGVLNDSSTIAIGSDPEDQDADGPEADGDDLDEDSFMLERHQSFERSVQNNQDFPLSSSFSNMYKKNGLHIEEGQVGR